MPQDLPMMKSMLGLGQDDLLFPRWSIVIPTLNEGERITHTIDNVVNVSREFKTSFLLQDVAQSRLSFVHEYRPASRIDENPVSIL